jgi:hypothetical protein
VEEPNGAASGGNSNSPPPAPGKQTKKSGSPISQPPAARRAAAAVLVFCLFVSVSCLTYLCVETMAGTVRGDRGAGRIALLMFQNESLHIVLKSCVAILTFGAAVIAEAENRPRLYYAVVALCVLGVIECAVISTMFAGYDVASMLYDYPGGSSITSYEKLQTATRIAMIGLAIWFLGVLSTQFGLSLPSAERSDT